jgi:hypothetical protein
MEIRQPGQGTCCWQLPLKREPNPEKSMPVDRLSANVTIVAPSFDPSSIGELWIVRNEVLQESDLTGQRLSTPIIAIFETARVQVSLTPERIQLTFKGSDSDLSDLKTSITNFLWGMDRDSRKYSLSAIGLNFIWKAVPIVGSVGEFSRDRFRHQGAFDRAIIGQDATWGTAVVSPALGGVRRITVLPVFDKLEPSGNPLHLSVDFNYHFQLPPSANATPGAITAIDRLPEAQADSDRIARSILDV